MEHHGFIKDMLDVKVLILFVMARVQVPIPVTKIYELCLQDDRLTYFDVCEAVPQLAETGHLRELDGERYEITDSGREIDTVMQETIAYPVAQRAKAAVEKFNEDLRRDDLIQCRHRQQPEGDYAVTMTLRDESGSLMTLELMAPTMGQAMRMERVFREKAERIYQRVMSEFLSEKETHE